MVHRRPVAVPFIDLKRLVRRVREEVLADWAQCLDECAFVGGARVTALEGTLAKVLGLPNVVSCANGTDALIVGLQALGIRAGDKVALPNLTFWATYEAVANLGATPVLVDVDPDDLQLSFSELQKAHDKHGLKGVILVHLYGWASARLGEIRAFCKEKKIALLEDGAQSFGVTVNGEPILAGAEMGTLSFYPAKVIGGAMDGGAIAMRSAEHSALVRSLCNHGRKDHYSYAHSGWNSRMGGLNASFLSRALALLPDILESRRTAVDFYRTRLSGVARVYGPPKGIVENGYLNVLTVEGHRGVDLVKKLQEVGIGSARTYPETIDAQAPAKDAIRVGDLAVSKRVCESVVNLPLFYGITEAECEESAAALIRSVR
jgi:dTDP-4-amino-4,6-dideoxygalactose transaminase